MQLVASRRRLDYTARLLSRAADPARADPHSPMFDPKRAVAHHVRAGDDDEAAWLVFLMTHFGKAGTHGWRHLKDVYGILGAGRWTWPAVAADRDALLQANAYVIGGRLGNHRKSGC